MSTIPHLNLKQDTRRGRDEPHGLGISGGSNDSEIDGDEVLTIKANPDGSAQGVSGVWLSNLYCGKDGDNEGSCMATGGLGGGSNNQLNGEIGSVEIDYLDPIKGQVCKSFLAVGTDDLGDAGSIGAVFIDFGEVLQMVGARISTRYPSDLGDSCPSTDDGYATQAIGNEFSVLGFVLDESRNSVDTNDCDPNDEVGCIVIDDVGGVTGVIKNPPKGIFGIDNQALVVDFREACYDEDEPVPFNPNPARFWVNNDGSLWIDIDDQDPEDIDDQDPEDIDDQFPDFDVVIPAHLCGIPNAEGIRQITILDVSVELDDASTSNFFDQIVELTTDDPINHEYQCVETNPYLQPVQTWIPRWWDPTEVPSPYNFSAIGDGEKSLVVQDVTAGACGSYGGRFRRLSYLASNLVYRQGTDFVAVIADEIDLLDETVQVSFACINNGKAQSTLSSNVKSVRKWFDKGNYSKTIQQLQGMRADVEGSRIKDALLGNCQVELATGIVYQQTFPNEGDAPALLWSYLLTQIDHLIYQVERKLP